MRVLTLAGRCVCVVLGLCLLCIVLLGVFFNPNDYRSDLERWLSQQTGRPFTFHGDLHWRLRTHLFLTLPALRIGPAADDVGALPGDFARWRQAEASVAWWPLLRGRLALGEVQIQGLRLNLRRDAQGRSNWEDLLQRFSHGGGPDRFTFDRLAGLQLSDVQIDFADQLQQREVAVQITRLTTSAVRINEPFKLTLDAHLSGHDATLSLQLPVELQVQVHADPGAPQITLTQLEGHGQLTAQVTAGGGTLMTEAWPWTLHLHELDWHGATQDFSTSLHALLGTAQVEASLVAQGTTHIDSKLQFRVPQLGVWLQSLGVTATTQDVTALQNFQVQLQASGNSQQLKVQVPQLQLDQTQASGTATLDLDDSRYQFSLQADQLNLDRYLPPKKASSGGQRSRQTPLTPLPVAWLRQLQATGHLQIEHAHWQGIDAQHLTLTVAGE